LVFDSDGINLNWFRFNAASMCAPTSCAALGASCGTPSNGCGGSLSCGSCVAGQTCNASNRCEAVSSGAEPCTPSKTLTTQTNSGSFGTTGPYCFRTSMSIAGWGCSNFNGRSLQVNDVALSCGAALPAKHNGYYYFESSNGAFDYASVYWWQ
jgi:endoglucanase